MQVIRIKNVEIGKGIPKICVPITGKCREEILKEIEMIKNSEVDLAEWRADFFKEGENIEEICGMLETINDSLEQIPVLFTFRTLEEGGEKGIMPEDYVKLLRTISKRKLADIIDIQVFFCKEDAEDLIKELKENGTIVLASSHHFEGTPGTEEMLKAMQDMEECEADILKLAVMPKSYQDLCRLLEVTMKIRECSQKPVVTMSMGKAGMLSRICGEFTGSCITFAAGQKASAPGQIEAEKLRKILEDIHAIL